MKRRLLRTGLTLTLALTLALSAAPSLALAGPMYVSARFAKIRDGKTATSAVLVQVTYGQALNVVGDEGSFWKVQLPDGRFGFIAKGWMSTTAPKKDGLAEQIGALARSGQGGQVSYTAGARGLTEQAAAYGKAQNREQATAAVIKMETFKVQIDDLDKFLQAGKLGEYKDHK
jgi:uncharacterized protein YgiM (DUF1202 family)